MDKIFDRGQYKEFKYCEYCGKIMTTRKKWKHNFESVKYCSEKCKIQSKIESKKKNNEENE